MKTCSTWSNLRDQYLSDYCEKNDKQNPLHTVNDVLYIRTSNTGPALLHTLVHCTNITVNYCIAVGWIQGKFTCHYLMMQALIGDSLSVYSRRNIVRCSTHGIMLLIRHSKPCGKAKITDFLQMDKVHLYIFIHVYSTPNLPTDNTFTVHCTV